MDENAPKIVHLVPARYPLNWHVFLLFIPAVLFALITVFLFRAQARHYAATQSTEQVLGEQDR